MKTFEDYLQDQFFEEEPQTLDDQFPDAFIGWLENLDIEEIIDYANKFFKKELKRITDEIKSKKKVDNKLGSTDLTLGEMFDRGLNSGYTQSIDIIKNNLT
jgi:hypothetical protein